MLKENECTPSAVSKILVSDLQADNLKKISAVSFLNFPKMDSKQAGR